MSTALTILIVVISILVLVILISYVAMLFVAYKFKKQAEKMILKNGSDIFKGSIELVNKKRNKTSNP